MSIADNLKAVKDRIAAAAERAGRDPSSIQLVVATKTVDPERTREAVEAGALLLGENRVQEARGKIELLGAIAGWHLIGHLQSNKARYAVKLFDLIHSVDSIDLAREINRQAAKNDKVQDILIEVNIAGEEAKHGTGPDDALRLVREAALLANISVRGLMTMPPFSDDPEDSRPYFRQLRDLSERIAKEHINGVSMNELSMGMSGDYEVGVEEGATMVRVGTAIFGKRV